MTATRTFYFAAALILAAYGAAATAQKATPATVVFEPVVVNDAEPNGVRPGDDLAGKLTTIATRFEVWMIRSGVRQGLAKSVQPVSDRRARKDDYVLHTTLSLPLTFAADNSPFQNQWRRGKFMEVSMDLTDASGTVAARTQFELAWGDGDWVSTEFVREAKNTVARTRANGFGHVLDGYIRKAVEHGAGNLARSLREKS